MASGLPQRVTLLTWEGVKEAEEMVLAGRPHRELLPVLARVKALAKQADNGVASGFLDIRAGVTDEEHMERQMAREARQLRRRRLKAMAERRGGAGEMAA